MGGIKKYSNTRQKIEFIKGKVEDLMIDKLIKNGVQPSKLDLDNLYKHEAFVFKQWGFEYCIKTTHCGFSVWMMHMYANHKSSFHCHRNKISTIKILEGSCLVETMFRNPVMVYEGDTVIFNKGVFHSEEAGPNGCKILQFESSLDKTDAIRFLDKTGKVGLPYEGKCKVVYLA